MLPGTPDLALYLSGPACQGLFYLIGYAVRWDAQGTAFLLPLCILCWVLPLLSVAIALWRFSHVRIREVRRFHLWFAVINGLCLLVLGVLAAFSLLSD